MRIAAVAVFLLVSLTVICTTVPTPATAQVGQKTVLVLYASRSDAPRPIALDRVIRPALDRGLAERLDYYVEYLDVWRFPEGEYLGALRDFLRRKYAELDLDIVIATTDAALEFANRFGAELFPDAAVVFSASPGSRAWPRSTGVTSTLDFKTTIDHALELQPDIRQIFVVSGASAFDKDYEDLARTQLRALENRVTFTHLHPGQEPCGASHLVTVNNDPASVQRGLDAGVGVRRQDRRRRGIGSGGYAALRGEQHVSGVVGFGPGETIPRK
jgi:hypothetical protein